MAAYCVAADVRAITAQDLTTSDISDANLNTIIGYAISQLNHDITTKVYEETASYIDAYRENDRDGSNTIYYVKNSFLWYLGDMNDDGAITTSDAEVWLYDSTNQTRTQATISAIDEIGKITLSAAPTSDITVKVSYRKSPVKIADPALKRACALLSTSMAYEGIDAREKKRIGLRSFSISKDPQAASKYRQMYDRAISAILSREPVKKVEQEELLQRLEYYPQSAFRA